MAFDKKVDMSQKRAEVPAWALDLLRCPDTNAPLVREGDRFVRRTGGEVARIEHGILCLPINEADDNIRIYRQLSGPHFWERATVNYAMSALDTPVYHRHLEDVRPVSRDAVIVDVGGGDGRNARPWLAKGYRRIVVVDAVADGLARFRARIADSHPEWLDRILLIEADARRLPLRAGCAEAVVAIESLFYLNEDYEVGVRQCAALLGPDGRLLVSERDYEGGLLLQLLYQGIEGMLQAGRTRRIVDGPAEQPMSSRCFSEHELIALLSANGLAIHSVQGISLLSVVLGWMRNRQLVGEGDAMHLQAVSQLLDELGQKGSMRRCHVVVASRRT